MTALKLFQENLSKKFLQKKIKVQKLLGTGKTINKMKITVEMASKGAIEKVKKAGGEVITQAPAKEVAKEAKKQ